jgi:hypothetical protein
VVGKEPWEYALSDCVTLCKGCHAREHGLIEPDRGWTLLAIDDLGSRDGVCERQGCGAEIRYEHLTYHPKWGYMVVGSTCIEHLTQEDRLLSSNILHTYENISKFVNSSEWEHGITQKGKKFIETTYKHHKIRIYGQEHFHSFQLAIKEKGVRKLDYRQAVQMKQKRTVDVKELSYITLKGTISDSEDEKSMLRKLYQDLRKGT